MKIQESGRSMIEMLGVLSIIGVLSVGGLVGYSKAMQSYKIYKVETQISDTMRAVQKYFPHSQYSSLGAMALNDALHLTAFDKVNGNLSHAMQGSVIVAECSEYAANDEQAFCIVLHDIERNACAELLAKNWNGKMVAIGVIANDGCYDEENILDTQANRGQIFKSGNTTIAYRGAIPMNIGITADACSLSNNTLFFKIK